MANRIVGNVYIVDSAAIALTDGQTLKIASIAFYSTDTSGEFKIVSQANTANALIHIRNNQNQPFTLPLFLGGMYLENLRVQTCTAGTGWFYLY